MLSRIGFVLLAMTAGFYAWARETGFVLRVPIDQAVNAELSAKADPRRVIRSAESAVARDDVAEAEMYLAIAERMGLPRPTHVIEALKQEKSPGARIERATAEFGAAVVTGTGASEAALTGAMSVAGSTAGDIRDILLEGSKAGSGGAYDQVVLGLSMAGLNKATDVKSAALWKVAHRNGLLQPDMRAALMDALAHSVPFDEVKSALTNVNYTDLAAAEATLTPVAGRIDVKALSPFLEPSAVLAERLGDAEAVKVTGLAQSTDELQDIAELSASLGSLTRGVVELTGVRKVADLRATTTLEEAVEINPVPVALWTAVVLAMIALGDFKILGSLPRSRPTQPKRMFRRMPIRQLHSLDGDPDRQN